ncbi:MAG: SGNH/GDSL hydrolase family protein [Acidobacteriota bacterium]|nr:SGNH/GDSL hydrolase family protein [Acidobacteriota bacterium]
MQRKHAAKYVLVAMGLVWPALAQQPAQSSPATATPKPDAAAQQAAELAAARTKLNDWPQLGRYRAENASLAAPTAGEQRVVFYGDSITDAWGRRPNTGEFFPGRPYVNRGISGQTTAQMVVRFEQDVVRLQPAVVLILAGTNDVAGNTGPMTPEMTMDNFRAMVAIAKQNHIRVVLASILPASAYPWKPGVQPAEPIRELNRQLQALCAEQGLVYVDYYDAMTNAAGGLDKDLASDGVHPTAKGYAIMAPLAEKGIAAALQR